MNPTTVTRDRMQRLASRWHNLEYSGQTFYLPPGAGIPQEISAPPQVVEIAKLSDTGVALFWSLAMAHLIVPPFPISKFISRFGWDTGPLKSNLDKTGTVAVLLLRLGGFAVGIYKRDQLISSKVGAPFVKGRHKKGGSSSGRFVRRRGEQARALFDKACAIFQEHVEQQCQAIDYVIIGGDRHTLQDFERRCSYLGKMKGHRLKRLLNVPNPRLRVLQGLPRQLYSSQLFTFNPSIP